MGTACCRSTTKDPVGYCWLVCGSRKEKAGRPRLLRRGDRLFSQSIGEFRVGQQKTAALSLYVADLWHSVLGLKAWKLILIVTLMYALGFVLFTFAYMAAPVEECGMGAYKNFVDYYQLSVQTMVTIGYGVEDPSFRSCPHVAVIITVQSLVGILLDAFCIGLVYDRISSAGHRGRTIVFSRTATMTNIGGLWHFQFRVADIRKHQLTEAHVRMVAFWHEIGPAGERVRYFHTENLRVHAPDDELGGNVLLIVPQLITHVMLPEAADRTNPRSVLLPSPWYVTAWHEMLSAGVPAGTRTAWEWREDQRARGVAAPPVARAALQVGGQAASADPVAPELSSAVRRSRSRRSGRSGGESVAGSERSIDDVLMRQAQLGVHGSAIVAAGGAHGTLVTGQPAAAAAMMVGNADRHRGSAASVGGRPASRTGPDDVGGGGAGIPRMVSAQLSGLPELGAKGTDTDVGEFGDDPVAGLLAGVTEADVMRFWRESEMEVICIVEGIESVSSDTTQARHSYRAEDLQVTHQFLPCVKRSAQGACVVDYARFHDTEALAEGTYVAPVVLPFDSDSD